MTYLDAWLIDPAKIDWTEGGYLGTGTPGTPLPEGAEVFHAVRQGVESGQLDGVQMDWGSWAARMPRERAEDFLATLLGAGGEYERRSLPHLGEIMRAARAHLAAMPPDSPVAIVVEEF